MNERAIPKLCLGALTVMLCLSIGLATGLLGGRAGTPAPLAPQAQAGQTRVAPASFITWESSFESAMQRAAATGKPVLVEFYTDWCPACKMMDESYTAPEVVAIAGNVITVRVNAETRTDLASQYGIHKYPTTMVLHSNGGIHTSFTGAYDAAGLARWLRNTFPSAVPS